MGLYHYYLQFQNSLKQKHNYKQLIPYLTTNDVLFDNQYGFREKHPTGHAKIELISLGQVAVFLLKS